MYSECSEPAAWGCSWCGLPLEVDAGCVFTAKDGKIPIFQSPCQSGQTYQKAESLLLRWQLAQRKKAVSIAFILCVHLVKSLASVLIVTPYQKREHLLVFPLSKAHEQRPWSVTLGLTPRGHTSG